MKLRELLQQMTQVQQEIEASEAFICGGTPRDRYMKRLDNISDVDITTGDKTVQYLSQEFGARLSKQYNVTARSHDDGHSSIYIGSFKMDFSSNFNVPNIEAMLAQMGIKNPNEMQKEMYSRDFTCNSLLLSLDLKNLVDPTKRGFPDIKDKIIRTCLAPEITLTTNKNRVVRAIYLASKLDFDIDPAIVEYVRKNPTATKISTEKVMAEKINEAFNRDADKASYYITKMGIWDQIPITDVVQPYYMKHTNAKVAYFQGGGGKDGVNTPTPKKKKYKSDPAIVNQPRFKEPFFRNYDLYDTPGEHSPGAGYHSLQKYKSVSEFLAAKRKKLKDKYKADDSWILDSGEITKSNPDNKKARAALLNRIIKTAIDFPIDDQIEPELAGPSVSDNSVGQANLIGGYLDKYLPEDDFEGKPPTALDFGRDYVGDKEPKKGLKIEDIEKLLDQYLSHGTFGLPDGVDMPDGDLTDPTDLNPEYGTLGPESLMYEDKWNI